MTATPKQLVEDFAKYLYLSRLMTSVVLPEAISEGAPDNVVRTVTENARTLKFASLGFEEE